MHTADPDLADYCERLYPRLYGAMVLHVGDASVAAELAQEALVRTVGKWQVVSRLDNPPAWTYRVLFNLANSRWRRLRIERSHSVELSEAHPERMEDLVADRLLVADLLRRVSPRQREVLVRRYFLDSSVEDMAESMKCRVSTVRTHLRDALAVLRSAPCMATISIVESEVGDG